MSIPNEFTNELNRCPHCNHYLTWHRYRYLKADEATDRIYVKGLCGNEACSGRPGPLEPLTFLKVWDRPKIYVADDKVYVAIPDAVRDILKAKK